MKNIFLLVLFLPIVIFSQDFEGEILFEYTFINQESGEKIESEETYNDLGTETRYITKKGFYKQTGNGTMAPLLIYNLLEKKLYYQVNSTSDSLYFKDLTKISNSNFEYEIIENATTILGYNCDKFRYKDSTFEIDFYFAKELKVDPENFSDFKLYNKNTVTELMPYVYLRLDLYINGVIVQANATKIEIRDVKDSEFDLPKYSSLLEEKL